MVLSSERENTEEEAHDNDREFRLRQDVFGIPSRAI